MVGDIINIADGQNFIADGQNFIADDQNFIADGDENLWRVVYGA